MKTATSCLKIVILGAPQVGKSAVTVRFLTKRFIGEYSSGTDCTYQTMIRCEGSSVTVEMIDCTSHWDGSSRHREADAYVIVYSVTDRASLNHAHTLLHTLHTLTTTTTHTQLLLLGNKTDLQHLRQVSHDDVTRVLRHYPQCRHQEVSAAESRCGAVEGPLRELVAECAKEKRTTRGRGGEVDCAQGQEQEEEEEEQPKRRRKKRSGLLGHVSRRLGRVFRRKSLDEFFPARRSSSACARVAENLNRRSV